MIDKQYECLMHRCSILVCRDIHVLLLGRFRDYNRKDGDTNRGLPLWSGHHSNAVHIG
jgi:hypothetical protein